MKMETPYDVTITGEHDDRDEHNEIVFDTHEDEAAKSHAHHARVPKIFELQTG